LNISVISTHEWALPSIKISDWVKTSCALYTQTADDSQRPNTEEWSRQKDIRLRIRIKQAAIWTPGRAWLCPGNESE
jgi:hypothetical protein